MQFPNLFDISEMFEIRWVRIAAASVLALFLLAFAGVLVVKYKESSTAGCECEGLVDHASLQLYNPFRDRTPERLGQSAMLAIQAHQCQRFPGPPIFCEEENHLTILSWKLTKGDITSKLDGSYVFDPGEGSGTSVTYHLEAELRVPIPGFIKMRAQSRIMSIALRDLKARVESTA